MQPDQDNPSTQQNYNQSTQQAPQAAPSHPPNPKDKFVKYLLVIGGAVIALLVLAGLLLIKVRSTSTNNLNDAVNTGSDNNEDPGSASSYATYLQLIESGSMETKCYD